VTEGEAAPAVVAEQGRNLLTRVIAALVLAPTAIVIAYAGGWLWAALVTLAAIGLYVEWLMIVDAARRTRVVAVAGGHSKRRAVVGALRTKLVDVIVTDAACARSALA